MAQPLTKARNRLYTARCVTVVTNPAGEYLLTKRLINYCYG